MSKTGVNWGNCFPRSTVSVGIKRNPTRFSETKKSRLQFPKNGTTVNWRSTLFKTDLKPQLPSDKERVSRTTNRLTTVRHPFTNKVSTNTFPLWMGKKLHWGGLRWWKKVRFIFSQNFHRSIRGVLPFTLFQQSENRVNNPEYIDSSCQAKMEKVLNTCCHLDTSLGSTFRAF